MIVKITVCPKCNGKNLALDISVEDVPRYICLRCGAKIEVVNKDD